MDSIHFYVLSANRSGSLAMSPLVEVQFRGLTEAPCLGLYDVVIVRMSLKGVTLSGAWLLRSHASVIYSQVFRPASSS